MKPLALALFFFAVSLASAQEARWAQLSQQAEQLASRDRSIRPSPSSRPSGRRGHLRPSDRRVGLALDRLGLLYKDIDEYADADSAFHRALDNFKASRQASSKTKMSAPSCSISPISTPTTAAGVKPNTTSANPSPPPSRRTARTTRTSPRCSATAPASCTRRASTRPAASVLKGAIAIYTHAGPAYNSQLAATWNQVGELVSDAGAQKEAETYFKKPSISAKIRRPQQPNLANYLGNLANVYKNEQRCQEGEPLYLRSIDILNRTTISTIPSSTKTTSTSPCFTMRGIGLIAPALVRPLHRRPPRPVECQSWTMSEQDRLVYLRHPAWNLPHLFSFITRYHELYPAIAGRMYDALLAERGFVAESSAASRARLCASGNRPALAHPRQTRCGKGPVRRALLIRLR